MACKDEISDNNQYLSVNCALIVEVEKAWFVEHLDCFSKLKIFCLEELRVENSSTFDTY